MKKTKTGGQLNRSIRLQTMLMALMSNLGDYVSGPELDSLTKTANRTADIGDLRRNGLNIDCRYDGQTRDGRRKSSFRIVNGN